jgi:enoyl reductase
MREFAPSDAGRRTARGWIRHRPSRRRDSPADSLVRMRAIVFERYGGPDVLRVADLPVPEPGPGQVRVRVRVAGVNPVDVKRRRGDFAAFAPPGLTFPQRLGNEYAGTVDALGSEVTGLAVGAEVLGSAGGDAYADFVVVPAADVVPRPSGAPVEVAGALPAVGQTAHTALAAIRVEPGDTLVVHAAAGGVGTVAVQLARMLGARVIGTASPANHDYLRGLGAIPVAHGPGLVERIRELAPDGVDAALDLVGGDAIAASLALVADRRRIGTTVDARAAQEHGFLRVGGRSTPALVELIGLVASGALVLPVDASYPLESAPQAHARVEAGHVRGKLALTL